MHTPPQTDRMQYFHTCPQLRDKLTTILPATTPRQSEKTSERKSRYPVMDSLRDQDKMLRRTNPLSDFNIQEMQMDKEKTLRRPKLRFCG